jgi:hypothetical protein
VDVTYKVPVGGKDVALLQRLRFSASLHKQRVDLPTSGNWMVLDYGAHTLSVIRDETREIVDLPAPETATQPGAAGFAKMGPASIAGFACTEWRTRHTGKRNHRLLHGGRGIASGAQRHRRHDAGRDHCLRAATGQHIHPSPRLYPHEAAMSAALRTPHA